ncbi:spore germination protein [Paenibacillus sp. HB172176]|uniref:spore germination protein n=1 Tax=Paenibacillus sp. HB172176 TaxID=2493690 RepID=UPI001439223D|nr:spore germination protein [Paenibacillus sp. HB172176]
MNSEQLIEQVEPEADDTFAYPDTTELEPRLQWYRAQLERCFDAVFHTFVAGESVPCAILYLQGMCNADLIQEHLLVPLLAQEQLVDALSLVRFLFDKRKAPLSSSLAFVDPFKALNALLDGHGLLLIDGDERIMDLPFPHYEKRSVEEAPNESVIRGPREAFVESLDTNVTLIRRRIRSPHFKLEKMEIGETTHTSVIIAYLDHICPQERVKELKLRLNGIKIDGVLGSSYLEEAIQDNPYSPFPQLQHTERPDTVSASILEGRIAVLIDNTPIVMLAPLTFFMMLQSAEDYYQSFIAASWIRSIRFIFLFVSLMLPSFYIAVTTFHPEMIPFNLLISVSSSREIVPFSALMEASMMEIAFEALREASVRIPKSVGQAVSIIGALVIGTAAVQAGIVSAAMVIIVSVTGIASFIIPNFDLGLSFRLLRFPMMFLAGVFGIFGIACGAIIIYVHMINLETFGVPYLAGAAPRIVHNREDTLIRAPWWKMRLLPFTAQANHRLRISQDLRGWTRSKKKEKD